MRARAVAVAERSRGATVLRHVRSEPPLLLRVAGGRLLVVGGAAGPLGGDELSLSIVVGPGAELEVGSVAAALALPGPRPSTLDIEVEVGSGARLRWDPAPLVSVVGSHHRQATRIGVAVDGQVVWRERTVFGRSGQPPGRLEASFRLERGGEPVLHQELDTGPPLADGSGPRWWRHRAVLDGARALISELTVGPPAPPASRSSGPGWMVARSPLGPDLAVASGLGMELGRLERELDAVAPAGPPVPPDQANPSYTAVSNAR